MRAGSHPRLAVIRRGANPDTDRLRDVITVDEVRDLKRFFGLSAADGGARVVIVDAADDLNPAAANAILKLLEEPPARAVLILIAHRPAGLLPTIRSRCRALPLHPWAPPIWPRALAQAGLTVEAPDAVAALAFWFGGPRGAAVAQRWAGPLRHAGPGPRHAARLTASGTVDCRKCGTARRRGAVRHGGGPRRNVSRRVWRGPA